MLQRYLQFRYLYGNSSVTQPSPALDLSFMLPKLKNYSTDEFSTVDNDGLSVPPLACAFAKMPQNQHILAVVDEDGYLVLYNTHKTGEAAVVSTWQAHTNAVFDLEWLQMENKILTGSGDQTVVLHDLETRQKLDIFKGHASSIKSISSKYEDDAVFISGSRDGHIMVWDKRIYHKEEFIPPVDTIFNAHLLQSVNNAGARSKRRNRFYDIKDVQQSVTVVLFQDDKYIISAGAADGCLKIWDMRKTYSIKTSGAKPVHVFHNAGATTRKHGFSSLILDSSRRRLFASCTDDVIYEYDVASYNALPIQTWRGHKNSTFYVKSALSCDDQFLMSGSSDEMAYIWQVNKPSVAPFVLRSHTAEVTDVAWCPNDITKVVTLSDDTKTKFWRVFCRDMKKQLLPQWLGKANKTVTKIEKPKCETPKETTIHRETMTATPPSQKKKVSGSSPHSPQSSIRVWLKRKAPSEAPGDAGNRLEQSCSPKRRCSSPQSPQSSIRMWLKRKAPPEQLEADGMLLEQLCSSPKCQVLSAS